MEAIGGLDSQDWDSRSDEDVASESAGPALQPQEPGADAPLSSARCAEADALNRRSWEQRPRQTFLATYKEREMAVEILKPSFPWVVTTAALQTDGCTVVSGAASVVVSAPNASAGQRRIGSPLSCTCYPSLHLQTQRWGCKVENPKGERCSGRLVLHFDLALQDYKSVTLYRDHDHCVAKYALVLLPLLRCRSSPLGDLQRRGVLVCMCAFPPCQSLCCTLAARHSSLPNRPARRSGQRPLPRPIRPRLPRASTWRSLQGL